MQHEKPALRFLDYLVANVSLKVEPLQVETNEKEEENRVEFGLARKVLSETSQLILDCNMSAVPTTIPNSILGYTCGWLGISS